MLAGVRLGTLGATDGIRLYPINFRHLSQATEQFRKYDIVTVDCQPAGEARLESWRPDMSTLRVETSLRPWRARRELLDSMIDDSMCGIRAAAAADARARSLALRKRFLDEVCAAQNDVAFYVGNQAKRPQTFSILGVYYPRK